MAYNKLNDECIMFRKLVSAYIDDQTGDAETRALSDHLSVCQSCKQELSNQYIVRDMIKTGYAPKTEVNFSSNIMMRLKTVQKSEPVPVKKVRFGGSLVRYGVVAALLFAALGSTVLYSQSKTQQVMAQKRKFDTYVVEHAEQYAAQQGAAAASVISVNFEK